MEFVLLIQDRRGQPRRGSVTPDEMGKFGHELGERGAMRGAAGPLAPEADAARVRVRDGRASVTHGPFAEASEVLVGFFAIDVPDRAAALEVAKRCPYARVGTVEVRAGRYLRGAEPSGARQFLLLYPLDRSIPTPGEEVLQQGMKMMREFTDELRKEGKYLGDGALPPNVPAARIETHQGKTVVTDGPFAESKEIMPGFAYVEAASRDEAIELAKRVPHANWGAVEVREVIRMQ
jgi:hypothetical protein